MLADMCELHRGVYVSVCQSQREFPQQEDETFDSSRKESSSLLSLMWSVCFSLFSFTLSSFFSVSSWFIAQVVFHPIRSSVPVYLLCVPTDGFVCLCVCGLVSWPSDCSVLCWGKPAVCVTLFATGLSPEHVCFIRAQWLPVDASVAWQKFRAQLDGYIRWRQIIPRDAVLARRFCS